MLARKTNACRLRSRNNSRRKLRSAPSAVTMAYHPSCACVRAFLFVHAYNARNETNSFVFAMLRGIVHLEALARLIIRLMIDDDIDEFWKPAMRCGGNQSRRRPRVANANYRSCSV